MVLRAGDRIGSHIRRTPGGWSGRGDNHLAEGVSLTDMRQRRGHLVEGEDTVDVDTDLARDAEVG